MHGANNTVLYAPGMSAGYVNPVAMLPSGTESRSSAEGMGDLEMAWTYPGMAVDGLGFTLCRSDRARGCDFLLAPGADGLMADARATAIGG